MDQVHHWVANSSPLGSFGFPSPGVLAYKTSRKAVLLQLRRLGKSHVLRCFQTKTLDWNLKLKHCHVALGTNKNFQQNNGYIIYICIYIHNYCIYIYIEYQKIYIHILHLFEMVFRQTVCRHSFSAGDWQHIFVATRCEGCGWRPSSLGARHRGCVSGQEKSLQTTLFFWGFQFKVV